MLIWQFYWGLWDAGMDELVLLVFVLSCFMVYLHCIITSSQYLFLHYPSHHTIPLCITPIVLHSDTVLYVARIQPYLSIGYIRSHPISITLPFKAISFRIHTFYSSQPHKCNYSFLTVSASKRGQTSSTNRRDINWWRPVVTRALPGNMLLSLVTFARGYTVRRLTAP